MSPATQFVGAGETLYGGEWRRKLGAALGVNERQIRRWATGEYYPPPGVWADIATICETQALALTELAKQLRLMAE